MTEQGKQVRRTWQDRDVQLRLAELPLAWRNRAAALERYAPAVAQAMCDLAAELETALREADLDTLTLTAAAKRSGYCREHLGRLLREGRIPNAGRPNAPRIRLGDLPRKAGYLPPERVPPNIPGTSKRQIVRSIVDAQRRSTR